MCNTLIEDHKLVQKLADGFTVREISEELKISRRTLESRLEVLKERTFSATQAHLVANFMRKDLVK